MIWLVLGVALWSGVHFIPTLARPLRQRLIANWGSARYRLAFSFVVVLSIALMVIGWRSTPEATLYQLPDWSRPIGFLLMIAAFILFGSAHHDTVIKRFVRHPQLMSIIVWAISHLITNGSTRALVLFGGLGFWALIEMPLINAREGAYVKPEAPGLKVELKGLAIGVAIFVYCWRLISEKTIWMFVLDAPQQAADLASRMVPPKWSYMQSLWLPLWDTLNIATLGTALAIVIAVPVAFCAARNTTPSVVFVRPVALFVIVSSRSINSLIWALMLVTIV
ncbi:MAG: NnrU family protein, partial [Pseudomonadota bacterium]|nr:NnrU family protein [Pseudomonadota bacterium]